MCVCKRGNEREKEKVRERERERGTEGGEIENAEWMFLFVLCVPHNQTVTYTLG